VNAIQGAVNGWNYDSKALTPRRDRNFGSQGQRIIRYNVANAYYYNTVYDRLDALAMRIKEDERLYKFIRGIYNPVKLENGLYVSYTYRGTIDTQTLKGGSMPLRYENTRLENPLKQLIKWSNLDQQLGTYVKDAALLGDAAWWICDEPDKMRVRLELIDPARIAECQRDSAGNVKSAVIEYRRFDNPDPKLYQPNIGGNSGFSLKAEQPYTFTMIATQDSFRTYKDGKPFAFYYDERGNPVAAWDNVYGFVPLKIAHFATGQDGWGQNSFFGAPRRQIDEINDQSSIINDSIRNVIVPILQAVGINAPSGANKDLEVQRDERTGVTIIYIPNENGELKPVTVPIDIAAASANRAVLVAELEKMMPIIALSRIRDIGGNLSGAAIENMFGDAIASVSNLRKQLDPCLIGALQMALSIGGIQGYNGFAGLGEYSYDNGDMEMSIAERDVIDNRLDKNQQLTNLISLADKPTGTKRKGLEILGISADEIDEIITVDKIESDEKARNAVRGAMQVIFPDKTNSAGNGGTSKPQLAQGDKPKQLSLPEYAGV